MASRTVNMFRPSVNEIVQHCFCIHLRFTEALEHLEDGLAVVNKLGDEKLAAYRWPGSQVIIDDTKPGKLLVIIIILVNKLL